MKIALIAPTGEIGRYIAQEAHLRGHEVTGIARRTTNLPPELAGIRCVGVGSMRDEHELAQLIEGHDVLVSALGFVEKDNDQTILPDTVNAMLGAVRKTGVKRMVMVGGAGTLLVAPRILFVDTDAFPPAFKPFAEGHSKLMPILKSVGDVDWLVFVPAAEIGPGAKIGGYRMGANVLIIDQLGRSRISFLDYASAFVDELEQHRFSQTFATVAY
ncbi:MAG: NAD(P)H-binding protein [Neisseriaceae bacterium]|nr:NAD(P)H-binding protein [Neisseriaceae bacterium]MBP6863252.1 NAD(P)H-binding protein [Neisseriaceae bacterium]